MLSRFLSLFALFSSCPKFILKSSPPDISSNANFSNFSGANACDSNNLSSNLFAFILLD